MTQTPDIFSLVDAAWKHPKYPCFCISPLEYGVDIDIHKHENREVLCSNRNKSSKEMPGNSRLQKHGKHVYRFHLTNRLNISYKQFYVTLSEMWLYESNPNAPSTCSEPGGKQWQHSIQGWRNWQLLMDNPVWCCTFADQHDPNGLDLVKISPVVPEIQHLQGAGATICVHGMEHETSHI